MKRITILVCALVMTSTLFGAPTTFMVNLATAKHKAAVEGKLYMVHFTANWCTPCKWMNDHTFTDDRVAQYLSDNYVPVKINVEDFDGIIIKQKNNVQFLPTLLIFNSKGEEVGRFEEAIGPSKLMAILEENNIPTNKEKIDLPEPIEAENPSAISRPILPSIFDDRDVKSSTEETASQNENTESQTEVINTPVYTPPSVAETKVNDSEIMPVEEAAISEVPVIESPTTVVTPIAPSTSNSSSEESLAFLTGEGIFELDVKYKKKQGYSVQIGLYAQYENVLAEVNKFKNMYQQNVYVHIAKHNGVTVYRLLMGSFDTRQSATNFENNIRTQGLECFVRDLSKI